MHSQGDGPVAFGEAASFAACERDATLQRRSILHRCACLGLHPGQTAVDFVVCLAIRQRALLSRDLPTAASTGAFTIFAATAQAHAHMPQSRIRRKSWRAREGGSIKPRPGRAEHKPRQSAKTCFDPASGAWARQAIKQAQRSVMRTHTRPPSHNSWLHRVCAYLHVCIKIRRLAPAFGHVVNRTIRSSSRWARLGIHTGACVAQDHFAGFVWPGRSGG